MFDFNVKQHLPALEDAIIIVIITSSSSQ